MNSLFGPLLIAYLFFIYITRISVSPSNPQHWFVPSSISVISFFLGSVSGDGILCIPLVVEVINVFFACVMNPEEAPTILLGITVLVFIGFITMGISDIVGGGGFEEVGADGSEGAGIQANEGSYADQSSEETVSSGESAGDSVYNQATTDGSGVAEGTARSEWTERAGRDARPVGLDLDGDGEIEGFDLNGDGEIDHNIIGVEVPDIETVDGYMREDGTYVAPYIRSESDFSTLNNLEPS